jgi:hypothetical protein
MKVDMSPKAVKGRLKLVSQLWRLSLSLGKAKKETDKRRSKSISLDSDKNLTIQPKNSPE